MHTMHTTLHVHVRGAAASVRRFTLEPRTDSTPGASAQAQTSSIDRRPRSMLPYTYCRRLLVGAESCTACRLDQAC